MNPKQNTLHFLISTLVVLTLAVACGDKATETPPPTDVPQTTLTLSGSGTTTLILGAVEPVFESSVPGYTLDILPGSGTGGGVKGLLEGVLDVAAMARPPKDEEAAQGVEYVEFGQSGVALYTHPNVGVTELTAAQVKAMYVGEITNWSQVGGSDLDIVLYARDEGDSSTKALRQVVFADTPFQEATQVFTSQSDMQAGVAGTPGSIGFGSWPAARATGVDVRAIVLDGVSPDDPAYPMTSPVGIGYLPAAKMTVQPLIDWLLSTEGQEALGEFGVVGTQ
jgi:phosphate transport system substrate-binding protein